MGGFLRALFSWWFLGLLLTLILCALIWIFGPRLAFDDTRLLASEVARLIVIIVLLVIWGILSRVGATRKAAAGDAAPPADDQAKPAAAAAGADAESRGTNPEEKRAIERERSAMRRRVGETMRTLRRSTSGLGLGGRWRYQLPWYLVLGERGAGKSALLANSGLAFPLGEPGALPDDVERETVWAERVGLWLTDDMVFAEPPGDLLEDAETQTVAAGAWAAFLEVIRRNRPRQPINGTILTLALPELLHSTPDELREHAKRLRNRLREVSATSGATLPIYVVFSHADRIAGFDEFFDETPPEDRAQVLGITLPTPREGGGNPLAALDPELDSLIESLNRRVLERLHREPDITRRGLAFGFPQQLAMARSPLRTFLDTLFRTSRYETQPLVRGIYFTSAEQSGPPVDLLRNVITAPVPAAAGERSPGGGIGRRSYFIADLLRRILPGDSDTVGLDPRFERRRRARMTGVMLACSAVVLSLGLAWYWNHSDTLALLDRSNRSMAEANQLTRALGQLADETGVFDRPQFSDVNMSLSVLRDNRDQLARTVAERPWRTMLGLYRGQDIASIGATAYELALKHQFLPFVMLHLEQRLADRELPDGQLYGLLRSYLMLGDQGPYDADTIVENLRADWNEVLAGRDRLELRQALEGHLEALVRLRISPPELNEDIVEFARDRLAEQPRGERGMDLLQALPEIRRLPGVRPADIGGPMTQRVLARRSGQSLQEAVPGVFTERGFRRVGKPAVDRIALALARDGWVMGLPGDAPSIANETIDIREEILQVYAERYARAWEALLADLTIRPFDAVEQAADNLSILGGSASPLRRIYVAAAAETDLISGADAAAAEAENGSDPRAALAAAGQLSASAASMARTIGVGSEVARSLGLEGQDEDRLAERLVTDRFGPLRELVGDNGEGPEMSALLDSFRDASREFTRLVHGPDREAAMLALLDGSGANGIPIPAALDLAAQSLPETLRETVADLARDIRSVGAQGAQGVIADNWAREVVPMCTAMTAGRFPFDPRGEEHISTEDFVTLFGPGGVLDEFYSERLDGLIDRRQSPWRWRPGRADDLGFAADTPRYFERVDAMRRVLFPNGAAVPTIRFQLRPQRLDAAADRVTFQIGEERLQYSHGVREYQSFEWEAADDGQVRLHLTPPLPNQIDGIRETGPWSFFRLLAQADLMRTDAPDRFDLRFRLGNRAVSFDLLGSSVGNPFGANLFSGLPCPDFL